MLMRASSHKLSDGLSLSLEALYAEPALAEAKGI